MLQNLLRERVPVRDLEIILETLADWIPRTRDVEVLTEYVRNALARTICYLHRSPEGRIPCITLDPKLEELINGNLERSERGTFQTMPPQYRQPEARSKSANGSQRVGSAPATSAPRRMSANAVKTFGSRTSWA